MRERLDQLLTRHGVDARQFWSLARAFVVMDLRGQHFARATATRPHFRISPLFWVVGQCLTASAGTSLLFFARVDVFFFAFLGLCLSTLVMATTVLVEFNEVVLDPNDLDIVGHRPISARTYAAARFANLLFYVALIYLSLNLFPLIVGAGLRDAGWWYAPAYLVASLTGSLVTVAVVVLLLCAAGPSQRLENLREVLAWTQIVLILVVVYGGQLMLRDGTQAVLVWGAFPPTWVEYLPVTWLARFVEGAALAPRFSLLAAALLQALVGGMAVALVVGRLSQMYRDMQPPAFRAARHPMPAEQVGSLAGPLLSHLNRREERIGYWLACLHLARDMNLRMRCLLPMNVTLVVVILGIGTGQFANPFRETAAALVLLPVLSVYLAALALPPILHNLSFSRDSEAAWLLDGAPLERPVDLARGASKAIMVYLATPQCLLLGLVMAFTWRDVPAALAYAALSWILSWTMIEAALALVMSGLPFTLPLARGSTLGPVALPMAGLSAALFTVAGLHCLFARQPAFWFALVPSCLLAAHILGKQADDRWNRMAKRGP